MADVLPEGTVTVVFTDVEGSTALRSALGDTRAQEVLTAHEDILRGLLREHQGVEVKALGDGLLLVFTSTRRAVEFAVAAHQSLERRALGPPHQPVRIRVGMHTGEVVARGGDLFGQAVHAAARIQAVARGGQTLVSSVVKSLVGSLDGVEWDDHGEHELKGFDEAWQLHAVLPGEPEPGAERIPLVGRDRERDRLLEHLDELGRGVGSLVLIDGEAGVGKSRLAEEAAGEARNRGFRVLWSRCAERGVASPFGPWVDLLRAGIQDTDRDRLRVALGDAASEVARVLPELRRIYPDIPEPLQLPADQERRFILLSVAEFLARAAEERPLVLVVDDLQWADESTLALLDEVAPYVPAHPILFIGAHRPATGSLGGLVARLAKDRLAERVSLGPLDRDGVLDLLTQLSGTMPPDPVVDALLRRTGGNTFFVEELFQHLAESGAILDASGDWLAGQDLADAGVPASIRLVLEARLERMGSWATSVLAAAAILGRSSELQIVGRVAGVAPGELVEALDAAERAGIVRTEVDPSGHTLVTFVHDLIRDTVLDSTTVVRGQQLHIKAADALLELVGGERGRAAEIATHLVAAGDLADPEVTCRILCSAGEFALAATAYADATESFERALELRPPSGQLRAEVLRGLGYALRSSQGWEASLPRLMEALDEYEALGDADAIGGLAVDIVLELGWAFRIVEAFGVIQRALSALGSLGADAGDAWVRLSAARAGAMALVGAFDEALDALEEVEGALPVVTDPHSRAAIDLWRGHVRLLMADFGGAAEFFNRAAIGHRTLGDVWQLAETLGWLAYGRYSTGQLDGIDELVAEGEDLARRLGHPSAHVLWLRTRRARAVLTGDLTAALEAAKEDERVCAEQGFPWIGQAVGMQAGIRFMLGDWDQAGELARRGMSNDVPGAYAGAGLGFILLVAAATGDAATVRQVVADQRDALVAHDRSLSIGQLSMLGSAVLALAQVGELEDAAALGERLRVARDSLGIVFITWDCSIVDLCLAVAAGAAGDFDRAWRDLAEARTWVAHFDHRIARPELERWEAWLLGLRSAPGDLERAQQLIDAATEGYATLGMRRHHELLDPLRTVAT